MRVDLRILVPNPFRDLIVDPIEDKPDLRKSINDDGFWGGCVIRKINGKLELAAGHSRVKEALACGLTHAELYVADLSDEVIVRIYARENATQRPTGNSLAGSIAAAIKLILQLELTKGVSEQIDRNSLGRGIGGGIGRDRILKILEGVPGINSKTVQQQLASLKDSGDYDRIVDKVIEEVEAKHKAEIEALERAERERQEAEARALEAEKKRKEAEEEKRKAKEEEEKQRAEARRKAAEEEEKAAIAAAELAAIQEKEHAAARVTRDAIDQHKQSENNRREKARKDRGGDFDWDFVGVSKHLKIPSHVDTFHNLVTGEGIKPYLPKNGQAGLAAQLVAKAEEANAELTSAFIRDNIYGMVTAVHATQNRINRQEQELLRKDWESKAEQYQQDFARNCRGMLAAAMKLAEHDKKKRPKGVTLHMTAEFKTAVEKIDQTLVLLRKANVI